MFTFVKKRNSISTAECQSHIDVTLQVKFVQSGLITYAIYLFNFEETQITSILHICNFAICYKNRSQTFTGW